MRIYGTNDQYGDVPRTRPAGAPLAFAGFPDADTSARIDFGPAGGRIEFSPDTRVDPFALVRLVQREPNSYRLEDGSRLRVTAKLDDVDARFERVRTLLEQLEPRPERPRRAATA